MYKYHQMSSLIAAALAAASDSAELTADIKSTYEDLGLSEPAHTQEVEQLVLAVHNQLANASPMVAFKALAIVASTTGAILTTMGHSGRVKGTVVASVEDKMTIARRLGVLMIDQKDGAEQLRLLLGRYGVNKVSDLQADYLNDFINTAREHLQLQAYRVGTPHPNTPAADDGPNYEADETGKVTNTTTPETDPSAPQPGSTGAEPAPEPPATKPAKKQPKPHK